MNVGGIEAQIAYEVVKLLDCIINVIALVRGIYLHDYPDF